MKVVVLDSEIRRKKILEFCAFTNIAIRHAIIKKRESHLATKNAGRFLFGLMRSEKVYET